MAVRRLMKTLIIQMAIVPAVEELPAWLVASFWHVHTLMVSEYGSAAQCAVVRRVRGGAPSLQVRWTLRGLASCVFSLGVVRIDVPQAAGVLQGTQVCLGT